MTALHASLFILPFSRRHDRTNPDVKFCTTSIHLYETLSFFLDLTADSLFLPKPSS